MARFCALTLLLLGPLVFTEYTARTSVETVLPDMRRYHSAADAKKLLFAARPDCPDVLVLGTSLSDRELAGSMIMGQRIEGERRVESPFNFGAGGVKPENMLMMWRWVRDQGCAPPFVLIEFSPIALNTEQGGWVHDSAFLSWRTWWGLPDGFRELRGYRWMSLAEQFTYNRLLIKRRRREIGHTLDRVTGLGKQLRGPTPIQDKGSRHIRAKLDGLPLDGHIRHLRKQTLKGKRLERERSKRLGKVRTDRYKHVWSDLHLEAIDLLNSEVRASGGRAIFHTPPTSTIYRDALIELDARDRWCEIAADYGGRSDFEWYDSFASDKYADTEYGDWYHLGPKAAKRYAWWLMRATRDKTPIDDPYCD